MRDNKISFFHLVIITCIALFLLAGCGFKGDPKYVANVEVFENLCS